MGGDTTKATGEGGASRTATVVGDEFIQGIEALSLLELRRRRDQALAEREYQSYLRRLVQVRQDILNGEVARRAAGQAVPLIEDRLKAVLSQGPQGRGRGEAVRVSLPEADVTEAGRRADEVTGESGLKQPEALTDEELAEELEVLSGAERTISSDRAAVIKVHDRLQEELKRRYREDPAQVLRQA
jgi:hypothetical protein